MKHIEKYLSPKWQELTKAAIKTFVDREELWCTDFPTDLVVIFEDSSKMFLKNAIFLTSDKLKETVIFTEHCGYLTFLSGMIESIKVKESGFSSSVKFNQKVEDILKN